MSPPFGKVLIANRGEIALRVLRTCRDLGIAAVAVYSTEDRDSEVVRLADEAIHIGPAPAKRSYLDIAAIIQAAAQSGADAVHPGYGFLSEDPDLAEVCEKEGFVFVGPRASVLAGLGDKSVARGLMAGAGLPLLPGSLEPLAGRAAAERTAAEIGYPLIVKAVAGGGGRGMRVARGPEDLAAAYGEARTDARAFFGDDRVFMERYLERARHVEVQVLCDAYGGGVHLGERDCTIQRRHQKLIEETPAPGLPAELLDEMRAAAVRGALAAGYTGAGTFEFLVDDQNRFYFMEVNGRIQVEHPVTELATGVDLVREQLRIAAGEALGFGQDAITPGGAVIECRVNAEDPDRGFAPAPGVLTEFRPPGGPFVRVDTHGFAGLRISPAYDSLLAKVVVWGEDRDTAIRRMRRALGEFLVAGKGVKTTIPFLRQVLDHPDFRYARHTTALAERMTARATPR
ncbi:acetyl-CoA carboxylase biotin carboxylase subunit [Spongiactinospora rosea]|uniref:biotin carboxylase n=1 Tax=Spongiactinospora rosea TaxID=2248750 RepID=A0A366M1M6_9ACTN|nr:acetyl-CoA carboxylase biotin carboxylase subunit [Spongiactinospora rosea]RBQ20085.1 acetyl-CoA carboxylase biotin carboxylase subunit [Spongiactinospora rosea]